MKTRLTYQSLVLAAVAAVLVASTALWAWHLHRSTHRLILAGFDRKLLAVAGGAAALVDAEAHAAYQRPRLLAALAANPDGTGLGFDPTRNELVTVDRSTGAARTLAPGPDGGIRSLATLDGPARRFGLVRDGGRLLEFDPAGAVIRSSPLRPPLDGLFSAAGVLLGWRGVAVYRVAPDGGALVQTDPVLPAPLRALAVNPSTTAWCGLSEDGRSLLTLSPGGEAVHRVALENAVATGSPADAAGRDAATPPPLQALAFFDGRLQGAGAALVVIDPAGGRMRRVGAAAGFFDPEHPFYRRHRAVFMDLQKRAGLTYLYSQVPAGGTEIRYILDGTVGRTYSPPGTGDQLPPASREPAELVQLAGRPWVSPIQQWEPWGLLKSCFTPLRTPAGQVAAMIGADVDISLIRRKTRWATFTAIMIGAGSLVAAGFVSWRVGRALRRPLQELKETALGIAAGYHAAAVAVGGGRDIAALARHLEQLRQRLVREEERWREWLEDLRTQRTRAALVQGLDDLAARAGALPEPDAAGATGACRVADTTVWWLGAPETDPAVAACSRARRTLLTRALLQSGMPPADLIARLVASAPDLDGAACWRRDTRILHYRTRRPVTLHPGVARRVLDGAGDLRLEPDEVPAWAGPRVAAEPPAAASEEHQS